MTFELGPVLTAALDKAGPHALEACKVYMGILIGVVLLLQLPLIILHDHESLRQVDKFKSVLFGVKFQLEYMALSACIRRLPCRGV